MKPIIPSQAFIDAFALTGVDRNSKVNQTVVEFFFGKNSLVLYRLPKSFF